MKTIQDGDQRSRRARSVVGPTEPSSDKGGTGITLMIASLNPVREAVGVGADTGPMMAGASVGVRAGVRIEGGGACTS